MTLPFTEAQQLTQTHRCGECGDGLLMRLADRFHRSVAAKYIVVCRNDKQHHTWAPKHPNKRKLYDINRGLVEVDIMTQEEQTAIRTKVDEHQMRTRVTKAIGVGVFPKDTTQEQQIVIANIAVAYGLDPLMGELIPYQGRPFITIAGRRRLDAMAGHQPGIKFRFLSPDERDGYTEAGVMDPGDLIQVCILTLENGLAVEGIGKVTKMEREAKSSKGGSRSPVVGANPIEMCQKRAERRVREMAYGPVPVPIGMANAGVQVLQEGDESGVVETTGEIVADVSAPPKPKPDTDPHTCPHGIDLDGDVCETCDFADTPDLTDQQLGLVE
jgi:hypothetical protein